MYCSHCGNEIEADHRFCFKCGHESVISNKDSSQSVNEVSNIHAQRTRSKRWYLLPIFLDIIGGIIAYYALRNDDRKLAKNCLKLGIILCGVYSAIFVAMDYYGNLDFQPNVTQHFDANVIISQGSGSNQNCATVENCFYPSYLTIPQGTTVRWTNADTIGHTVTSGRPSDSQTGTVFDSSLIPAGKVYSFTFEDKGTYNYFCQVHPWMTGQVIVKQNVFGT